MYHGEREGFLVSLWRSLPVAQKIATLLFSEIDRALCWETCAVSGAIRGGKAPPEAKFVMQHAQKEVLLLFILDNYREIHNFALYSSPCASAPCDTRRGEVGK